MGKTEYTQTEGFIINEGQPHRVWVHSKERGFGRWIYDTDLELLFKNSEVKKDGRWK